MSRDDLIVGLAGSALLGTLGGLLLLVLSDELGEVGGVLADVRSRGGDLVGRGLITGSLVRSAGNGVSVVVRDSGGLGSDAAGGSRTVHGAVSASAGSSLAVDADGTVGTGALGELTSSSGDLERSPLGEVLAELVGVTLHLNGLTEVLITVHAGGEEHVAGGLALDTVNTSGLAGVDLDEARGGGELLVPGGLVEEGRSIGDLDSGGRGKEQSNDRLHFLSK